jgi:hypothetical protein
MPDLLPVAEWLAKSAARAVGAFLDSLARPRDILREGDAQSAAQAAAADVFAEAEAEQDVSEPSTRTGCTGALVIGGQHYWCDSEPAEHPGWACASTAAGAIWDGPDTSADPPSVVDDPAGGAPASAPHPPAGSPPNFAGAAASLADGSSKSSSRDLLNPSVREDKRQDGVSQGPHPADPQPPTVPVAVSARTIPAAPATGLDQAVQVICEVLAEHEAYDYAGDVECCHERGGAARFPDWQAWREHVAQPIAERLTGAIQLEIDQFASDALRLVAMTFPQSQKHSK